MATVRHAEAEYLHFPFRVVDMIKREIIAKHDFAQRNSCNTAFKSRNRIALW